jgi:hypothetical protein
VRHVSTASGAYLSRSIVLSDGSLLLSSGGSDSNYFLIDYLDGRPQRSFGRVSESDFRNQEIDRTITSSDGKRFWATWSDNSTHGYVLEEWDATGARLLTLRRNADWFTTKRQPDGKAGPAQMPPPSGIEVLHQDDAGLILVLIRVADRRWTDPNTRPTKSEEIPLYLDLIVEVIDPDAGVVLASLRVDDPRIIPYYYPSNGHLGFVRRTDASGIETLEGQTYRLLAR